MFAEVYGSGRIKTLEDMLAKQTAQLKAQEQVLRMHTSHIFLRTSLLVFLMFAYSTTFFFPQELWTVLNKATAVPPPDAALQAELLEKEKKLFTITDSYR